jgi:hypothetical protein
MTFGVLAMLICLGPPTYAALAGLALRLGTWFDGKNMLVNEVVPSDDDDMKWLWATFWPITMTFVVSALVLEGIGWGIYYGGTPLWWIGKFFYTFCLPKRNKVRLPKAKVVK